MAFLCPSRLGKVKNKRGYYNPMMGRITGSDSIETLVKLELGKQNANNPETRRIILQSFTGCAPEEISVKQGQKVHILFREGDWAYVLTQDKKQGYVPFAFCARMGKPPSYRAPKLNKDKEKLLENDEIGVNDDDETLHEIDTTLAEPRDDSYYSEFVSNSFVSDEWSEQDTSVEKVDTETLEPEKENIEDNQYSESVTIVLDDDQINEPPEPDSKDSIYTNSENLGQSVVINKKTEKRHETLNSRSKETVIAFKTTEKRPEIASAQNKQTATAFNTKVPLGRYLVLYDFEGHYEDDARVRQADIVTVLNMDDTDWYWVRKTDNTEGFVPSNFLFRLGLLLSDSKEAVSSTFGSQDTKQNSITEEEPHTRTSLALPESPNSPVRNGTHKEHHTETSYDDHKQYVPPEESRVIVQEKHQEIVKPNQWSVYNQDNMSSPTVGSLSPRYCNFSFQMNQNNGINTSVNHSSIHFDRNGVSGYSENHLNTDDGVIQENEELYPPPLEFSNSTDDSYEAYQEMCKPDIAAKNVKDLRTEYGHPTHVRNTSQPVNSLNMDSSLRFDLKGSPSPGNFYNKHQNAQVRYRTDSNGKRVSKNKARPKSTPPGDLVLQNSQYYINGNDQNQHYDPQQSARISGHQSERLTPRTNYNYSPTYHSSVWKPFQQLQHAVPMPDNVTQFEFAKGHSAFENPKSNRYSMYAYTNLETYVDTNVSKSGVPNFGKQEGPYYPSGVHNIRSTKDNISPPLPVHNAIRKLSDEENQKLFRKLDNIQNSFDGDDPAVQDTKPNEHVRKYNNNKQNSETGFTERANNQQNEIDNQNCSSTSPNQRQNTSSFVEKPKFSTQTRKSYKMATQGGAERENKTSHTKHLVHSYSPVEGNTTEELNHSGKKSKMPNNVKLLNTDNQSAAYHNTPNSNIKLYNINTLSNGVSQENMSGQKASHPTKIHDKNGKNKQNENNYKENGLSQMTELISQFDYNATSKTDLPLEKGEVVHVSMEEQDNKHWYWAYSPKLRRHGYVPRKYVQVPQITMI